MNEVLFSHKSDEWETPQELFDTLNNEFNFDLDVCANEKNRKCDKYFDMSDNGLLQNWCGSVWCNPPYSKISDWVAKANIEKELCKVIVMLVPARTDTRWFHAFCYNNPNVEIRFIKGRLKFSNSKNSAPFPSMLLIFRRRLNDMMGDSGLFNNTMGARAIRGEITEDELMASVKQYTQNELNEAVSKAIEDMTKANNTLNEMLKLACVTLSSNVGVGMHPTRWLTPEEWRKRIEGWVEK